MMVPDEKLRDCVPLEGQVIITIIRRHHLGIMNICT